MAWSSASLAAAETAALALDLPILVGNNVADHPSILPIWSSDNGYLTDTDRSDTDGPAWLGINRLADVYTMPGASPTDSEWFFVIEAVGASKSFDCLAIINHNLGGISGIAGRVQIADNTTFSTNLVTVLSSFTPNYYRHLELFSSRYSGGGYIRLRLTASGNFIPQIGEIWFGRRRQLRTRPRPGGDIDAIGGQFSEGSVNGAEFRIANYAGRREFEIELTPRDDVSTLRDRDTLRSWWQDTDHGRRNFLWTPNPSTDPHTTYVMTSDDTALALERRDPSDRTTKFAWHEEPPFLTAQAEAPTYDNAHSLLLAGTSARALSIPNNSIFESTTTLTVSAWMRFPSSWPATPTIWMGMWASGQTAWMWRGHDTQDIRVYRSSNGLAGSAYVRTSGNQFAAGTGYHILWTYSSGTDHIWINGVDQSLTHSGIDPSSLYNGTSVLGIGYNGNSSTSPFAAGHNFDEVAIWTRVLSNTEIADVYNGGASIDLLSGGLATNLGIWMRFENDLLDSSGNGNNGGSYVGSGSNNPTFDTWSP